MVVRGTLVNLGFLLQAKSRILGMSFPRPTNLKTLGSLFVQLSRDYPEALFLTAFFATFGLVIALMKDVPDVKGDTENRIKSFSVRLGEAKMFR